ncbi:secondary thiamine-phosphate synthase enzyme YjbQ [Nitratiruptor tergarcus]|uniref:Secondary thiamine-phosphate synthase enzyme n=1 Tax=Nitratiruptor tergarcus DSM 16512 TaxID=1069081 RepID=A0A1W1WRU5_9BACT|nr:secondary thiamine-phosphate synthase enzyme YjbQ [Nitratiruptor tergarcus]SMC08730.1 secondary thiamine-phosphate synthase enzyme [Nitratiruptor tergarcus DSM 16512]
MRRIEISTNHKSEMIEITEIVKEEVIKSGVTNGSCIVYSPHTTTGILLFENVDPELQRDFLAHMSRLVPKSDRYAHGENADAHLKSALTGNSVAIPVVDAKLMLGKWQGIYFCEYDGPREVREFFVKVVNG